MKYGKHALIGLLVTMSVAASAQSTPDKGFYGEIGYTSINYTEPGYALSPAGVLRVLIGNNFHENFALEGMAGFGASDGSLTISGVNVKGRVDSTFGIYLKPKAKLSESIEVFGRVGFAESKLTVTAPGIAISSSGSSASYGVGASFNLSKTASLNADYMSYYSKDGTKADGLTVGVGFRF